MSERLKFFTLNMLLKNFSNLKNNGFPRLAVFKEDGLSMKALVEGFYELPFLLMLEKFVFNTLSEKRICLDIGANIGNHATFFANKFQKVMAFEPNLRTFKLLEANAMLFSNIHVYNFGFSNSEHTEMAYYDEDNMGGASLHAASTSKLKTEFSLKTLDNFLTADQIKEIDFIKIDVEGHEKEVFLGASNILKNGNALICMEVLEHEIVNGTSEALNVLNGYGYNYIYEPIDTAPFATFSKALAKLTNAFSVLLFDKKVLDNYKLQLVTSKLSKKKYDMLIIAKSKVI